MAPKQRVMYDIINKAQNITLPVVTIDVASISRDESRVFNKLEPAYMPRERSEDSRDAAKFLMPVPVNIEVNMSILARYMADMDQIISNFIPYTNPYIILSWKIPDQYNFAYDQEIRSPVEWSGSLTYNNPTDTTYSDKFRIVVDTSFTIKGWLFPENKETVATIYKVDANFVNTNLKNRIYSPTDNTLLVESRSFREWGFDTLSAYNDDDSETNLVETVTISGTPNITNIFYASSGDIIPISDDLNLRKDKNHHLIVYGKRFDYSTTFYLSSDTLNFHTNFQEVETAKSPTISAYELDSSLYSVINDNILNIKLPLSTFSTPGKFTLIARTDAGWGTSYQASSSVINMY